MVVNIFGREVSVDIRRELEQFDWIRSRWTEDKLIAASPFRYESHPSFFVSLEHGGWRDSGSIDSEWSTGGFVKLLAYLRRETYEETAEYLLAQYAYDNSFRDIVKLEIPKLTLPQNRKPLDMAILTPYKWRHPYLGRRGISEAVQLLYRIGYDKTVNAVTFPWFTTKGLANVKYRRVDSKIFWYHKGAWPIRQLVYGIDIVYRHNITEVLLCEAEIDAMYATTVLGDRDVMGVALGGANISEEQAGVIARSPIERVVIAADNDEAGQKLRRQIIDRLGGVVSLEDINYVNGKKDLNEMTTKEVEDCFINSTTISKTLRFFV